MAHIFHFGWKNEKTPQFEYGEKDTLQFKGVAFDKNLSLTLAEGPFCAGYIEDKVWKPCAHKARGSRKCEDCRKKEGLSVAQFCDGYNLELFSPEQLEQLNTPHYLYLALFQKDIYKIGVSSLSRGLLRQIEQGSHVALIFAEGMGGILARQAETFFRKCGIIDKVPMGRKKEFFAPEISREEGESILRGVLEKYVPSLLFDRPEIKPFLLDHPKLIFFDEYYNSEKGLASSKPFHTVTLEVGEGISGTLLSVKGSLLLLETDHEKVLISAKDLLGYEVDFSQKPLGLTLKTALQGALF